MTSFLWCLVNSNGNMRSIQCTGRFYVFRLDFMCFFQFSSFYFYGGQKRGGGVGAKLNIYAYIVAAIIGIFNQELGSKNNNTQVESCHSVLALISVFVAGTRWQHVSQQQRAAVYKTISLASRIMYSGHIFHYL